MTTLLTALTKTKNRHVKTQHSKVKSMTPKKNVRFPMDRKTGIELVPGMLFLGISPRYRATLIIKVDQPKHSNKLVLTLWSTDWGPIEHEVSQTSRYFCKLPPQDDQLRMLRSAMRDKRPVDRY